MGARQRLGRAAVLVALCCVAEGAHAQLPVPLPEQPKARIVFNADESIYTVAADGSGRTRVLAGGPAGAFDPAWSPDGGSIAFSRGLSVDEDDERVQIWAMASDGSGERPVSAPPRKGQIDHSPAWSPDGERIAFVRFRFTEDALVSSLITAAASGGDERVVTEIRSTLLSSYGSPAWSPDGNRILLTRQRLGKGAYFRPALYVVDVASGARTELAADAQEGAWSPDGDRIAYSSIADRNGQTCGSDQCSYNGEIYVMRADGGERRRLTDNKGSDAHPDWSADGERIVFASDRNFPEGENPELYSIGPDGSCLTWLTNGTAGSALPDWEPGSGRSTDPGGCGAVPREPLIETDTGPLSTFREAPVWWLGTRFNELLLSDVSVEFSRAYMSYLDCARFEPSECPKPLTLDVTSTCTAERIYSPLRDARPRNLSRHEGALVNTPTFDEEEAPQIYVGTSSVDVDVDVRDPRPLSLVLGGLRRFGEDAPPADGLPLAKLPLSVLRPLERTRAAHRKYGSVNAAVKRVGGTRAAFRDRLALDRRLRQLGPFGRESCRRR